MKDLRKVVPPKREILRGIWLSFYHGAKIGVLGANGAGKSTLLRIMAGVDHDFMGDARPADGIRIGYLPQEPRLDPGKDVRGNLEEGVAATRALLAESRAQVVFIAFKSAQSAKQYEAYLTRFKGEQCLIGEPKEGINYDSAANQIKFTGEVTMGATKAKIIPMADSPKNGRRMVHIDGITMAFGSFVAVENVSLDVRDDARAGPAAGARRRSRIRSAAAEKTIRSARHSDPRPTRHRRETQERRDLDAVLLSAFNDCVSQRPSHSSRAANALRGATT